MNDGTDRTAKEGLSFPRFLGNAGKEQEVSSVFAAILAGGCHQGNESQGAVQNNWLDSVEKPAREKNLWINMSTIASVEIGHGHENTVFLSKDGKNVVKFNNFKYAYNEESLIQFIERINSHNEFSKNSPYAILGFTRDPRNSIGLVMSQPFIKNAMEADSYTIESYLTSHGYRMDNLLLSSRRGWTNDRYEFNDAVPRNVLMDRNGDLYFIDLQINNPERLKLYLADYKKFKENQIVQLIYARIKDSGAKSFCPEAVHTILSFLSNKKEKDDQKAVLVELHKRASAGLSGIEYVWAEDVLEELLNLAEGKIRDQSQGLKW